METSDESKAAQSIKTQGSRWHEVMEHLLSMVRLLETADRRPVSLLKFAEAYAGLSRAYLAAITHEGRSSMRAEAVVKALDLGTAKSTLLRFLDRLERDEQSS